MHAYAHDCDCDACLDHCLEHELDYRARMQLFAAREYAQARLEYERAWKTYRYALNAQETAAALSWQSRVLGDIE